MSNKKTSNSDLCENVPLLSFFTGAGFMDIGFLQQAFKIIHDLHQYEIYKILVMKITVTNRQGLSE